MKKLILFLVFLISFAINVQAQTTSDNQDSPEANTSHVSPSLQIGLSGLNFTKGAIDPAIISELINRKQKEVKVRVVKWILLKELNFNSGLMYAYLNSSIDILTTSGDQETRMKNLLENTVNVAFVMGYTKFYYEEIMSKENQAKLELIMAEEDSFDINKLSVALQTTLKSKTNNKIKIDANNRNKVVVDIANVNVSDFNALKADVNFKNITTEVPELTNVVNIITGEKQKLDAFNKSKIFNTDSNDKYKVETEKELKKEKEKEQKKEAFALLIDMTAQAIKENDRLQQLGLLRTNYYENFASENAYLSFLEDNKDNPEIIKIVNKIYNDIKQQIDCYVSIAGLISSAKGNASLSPNGILSKIQNQSTEGAVTHKDYKGLKDNLMNYSQVITIKSDALNIVTSFLTPALNTDDKERRIEQLAEYEAKIAPALSELITENSEFLKLRDDLHDYLTNNLDLNGFASPCSTKVINPKLPFIQMLGSLNKLDKADTYAQFLDYLVNASEVFPNDNVRQAMSFITGLIRSSVQFTENSKKQKVISLDAENFLVNLQKISFKKWIPISPVFTVGVNNSYFFTPLKLNDANGNSYNLHNFAYFGEKIGVKWKIVDWKFTHSQEKGALYKYYGITYKRTTPPNDPIISNFNLQIYGSGLLYNLIKSGTSKEFNYPILSIGTGFTFFNGLDVTASLGAPILKDQQFFRKNMPALFNFGIDVQFADYIQLINEKTKETRNKNLLKKAYKN